MIKHTFNSNCIYLLFLLTIHCTTTAVQKRDHADNIQADTTSTLARHTIKGPLNLNVLSSENGISEQMDINNYRISIPVATKYPVECFLNEGNLSPFYKESAFFEKTKNNKNLKPTSVKNISGGVLNHLPYIYLEKAYLTDENEYVNVKLITLSSKNFMLTCQYNEADNQKTFLQVIESLTATNAIQKHFNQFPHIKSRHINEVFINEQFSGIMENIVFETEENTLSYYSMTDMLTPINTIDLINSKSIEEVQINNKTGAVTSGKYYSYKNNEEEYQISLERNNLNAYVVTGTLDGKKIEKTIITKSNIMYLEFIANEIISNPQIIKDNSLDFNEFLANDPFQTYKSKIIINSYTPEIVKLMYSSNNLKMDMKIDIHGISHVHINNDGAMIKINRIYSK
ncbi:MAG: hypothetical protein OEV78_02755 [Spirochaetia bacterium]|nr:hypothetical protein [Spirochaetia bacterium]